MRGEQKQNELGPIDSTLARPETATDGDFWGIERVIAHEYFHN